MLLVLNFCFLALVQGPSTSKGSVDASLLACGDKVFPGPCSLLMGKVVQHWLLNFGAQQTITTLSLSMWFGKLDVKFVGARVARLNNDTLNNNNFILLLKRARI